MRLTLPTLALLGAGLLLGGCDEGDGRTDPPNVSVRVIHAAPNVGPVVFRRVNVNATPLNYLQGSDFSFDVDTYTFNFEILAVDSTVAQTISMSATLVEGSIYIVVLREVGGQPVPLLIERPATTQGTGTEIEILHAATTTNAVDVFLELENFDLTTATARGTIDFDDVLSLQSLVAGNYEIVLTEPSIPANVLLDTESVSLIGAQGLVLLIVDGAGIGLSTLAIALGDNGATTLIDRNLESGIRVINALSDRSTIDAGVDGQFVPPLITGVPFGIASSFELISAGSHDFNVTPTLTPTDIDIDETFDAPAGLFATWLVTGTVGAMNATLFNDDFRVISGESQLRVFHGSPQNDTLDVFVAAPGTDIASIPPFTTVVADTPSPNFRIPPGDYEITIQDSVTEAILAGPIAATIAADGYYGILLHDPAAGTGLEVTLLFDF